MPENTLVSKNILILRIRIRNAGFQEYSAGRLKSLAAREKISIAGEILQKADKT